MIPYIGEELGDIKYLGLAVFKDSKLIDIIDINDTKPLLYLLADTPKLIELIPNPKNDGNKYSFRVSIDKRKILTDYKNNTVVININLNLDAELRYQYYINKITDEMIKDFENEISTKVTNEIIEIIKTAQRKYKCDIFKFGEKFKAQNYEEYKKINWTEEFLTAKINVNVKTKMINKNLKSADKKE